MECQKMNGHRCQTAAGEARIWQGIRPGKRREVNQGSVVQESGVDIDICKMKMKTSYRRWIDKAVKYADDQGMVANTEAGLQSLMDSLGTTTKHYDMKINIKKTKALLVSRNGGERVNIIVEGQSVEQVSKFRYLGSLILEDDRCLDDVKTRIGMAKD